MNFNSKILLHICCAPCGVGMIEKLLEKGIYPILFYYNPNIQPKNEYKKREESVKELAKIYNLELITKEYNPKNWFLAVKGYEKEKEGQKRCEICFKFRISETAKITKAKNLEFFSTTLSASPYKSEEKINEIGEKIAKELNLKFLSLKKLGINKKENWQKSRELSKKYKFYRQKYCGCIFSLRSSKFFEKIRKLSNRPI